MRIRYDEATMEKISRLVLQGKTNGEICEEFKVEHGYSSLCNKCRDLRKKFGVKPKAPDLEEEQAAGEEDSGPELMEVTSGLMEVPVQPVAAQDPIGGVCSSEKVSVSRDTLHKCVTDMEMSVRVLMDAVESRIFEGFSDDEIVGVTDTLARVERAGKSVSAVAALLSSILDIRRGY